MHTGRAIFQTLLTFGTKFRIWSKMNLLILQHIATVAAYPFPALTNAAKYSKNVTKDFSRRLGKCRQCKCRQKFFPAFQKCRSKFYFSRRLKSVARFVWVFSAFEGYSRRLHDLYRRFRNATKSF